MKFGRTVMAGISAAAMVSALPSAASARASCSNVDHCYAISWGATGARLTGVSVDLRASCLRVASPSRAFLSQEVWMLTNSQPGTATWVEIGLVDGGLTGSADKGLRWFWADYRGRWDGFNQHVIGPARTGTTTNVAITYAGHRTWHVLRSGRYVASSAHNGTYGTGTEAGAESTSNGPYLDATADNYRLRSTSSWFWASGMADTDTPPFRSTLTDQGRNFHAWSSHPCPTAKTATSTQGIQGFQGGRKATPMAVAAALASAQGEPHPVFSQVVRTTRRAAEELVANAEVADDTTCYVIELHGHFVAHGAPIPQGIRPPTGTTLTVTVDAADGEITDWTLR